ncbi:MAG: fliQ [Clostridiales bacterium]|jgi:flagellar biosynthetic protein FliQ|nr:fliQ [Clostridiales bacterium]
MSESFVVSIGNQAITTALTVAAPVLIVSMVIGLIISIFQAVTQIQEQTLTFVPKLLAIVVVFIILGPWMLQTIIEFIQTMLNNISYVVK